MRHWTSWKIYKLAEWIDFTVLPFLLNLSYRLENRKKQTGFAYNEKALSAWLIANRERMHNDFFKKESSFLKALKGE